MSIQDEEWVMLTQEMEEEEEAVLAQHNNKKRARSAIQYVLD
jgi:hypothetical protein